MIPNDIYLVCFDLSFNIENTARKVAKIQDEITENRYKLWQNMYRLTRENRKIQQMNNQNRNQNTHWKHYPQTQLTRQQHNTNWTSNAFTTFMRHVSTSQTIQIPKRLTIQNIDNQRIHNGTNL